MDAGILQAFHEWNREKVNRKMDIRYYREKTQKTFSASSNQTSAYAYTMQSYMNGRSVY